MTDKLTPDFQARIAQKIGLPTDATARQIAVRIRALRAEQAKATAAQRPTAAPPPVPKPAEQEWASLTGNLPDPRPMTDDEAWADISAFMTMGRGRRPQGA